MPTGNCETCRKYQKSNSKELIPSDVPTDSWEIVGTDLFYINTKAYLIVVDYYSKYVEFGVLNNEFSETIVELLKSYFSRFGVPNIVRSDNGPQFDSKEFKDFARE